MSARPAAVLAACLACGDHPANRLLTATWRLIYIQSYLRGISQSGCPIRLPDLMKSASQEN
jgi:hypothetical protein